MIASPYTSNINYDNKNHQVVGERRYELSNHLGNVFGTDYEANIRSYSGSHPYGMILLGSHGNEDNSYRYGFQGQEMNDEITEEEAETAIFERSIYNLKHGKDQGYDTNTTQVNHFINYLINLYALWRF